MDTASRFFAHSLPKCPIEAWEPLTDHLRLVAAGDGVFPGAAGFASAFDAAEWGQLLGWWHDLGKFSTAFQSYLRSSAVDGQGDGHDAETTGRVDHSTAGAQHAISLGQLGQLLAYCIAGHHAGLPDNVGDGPGRSGLSVRLKKDVPAYDAAPLDILNRPSPPVPRLQPSGENLHAFTLAFFTRMLFSCLVDADFLATESFMSPQRAADRPQSETNLKGLLARLNLHLEEKQRASPETSVNRQRRQVLAACRKKAMLPPGLFSLTVPTGGGKTFSSLAFALTHAIQHDLRRVIYAIPFTSIIEQTAQVFRDAVGDLQDEVLEHHSNLEPDDPKRQSTRSRLAAENFDAPLVVTTNVQLFESLFASRTSFCRKLHRLARSVIVLDEAQTLPPDRLTPTLAALNELVLNYGTTVVLCTATQPAVEKREGFRIGLEGVRPIIDEPQRLHQALRRTRVERAGTLAVEELANRLGDERQVLCVVNSRRHAADLYNLLDDGDTLHLSASMCGAHRSDAVAEIRRRLDPQADQPCRVISTQVIEAGVDVDFPAVYRAAAGLDSVAQAAGRCNREGKLVDENGHPRLGRVVVFDYDTRDYRTLRMIELGASHFREVLPDHVDDLLSPAAIEAYFRLHYWQQGGDDGRGWDRDHHGNSVLDCFTLSSKDGLHAQFRTAAELYQLIDDAQTPVLVPYGQQGKALIRELENMPDLPDPKRLRAFDRAAQRYIVGVYKNQLRKLEDNNVLLERHERYYLANQAAYHKDLGLTFEEAGLGPERSVL